jgi:carbon monoxide dehydrogenase subunit G
MCTDIDEWEDHIMALRMHVRTHIIVHRSPETVFQLLADLPGYASWLPPSLGFLAISDVSTCPVQMGTTYIDTSPAGRMSGSVTLCQPPTSIVLQQGTLLQHYGLRGEIKLQIHTQVKAVAEGTLVTRTIIIQVAGALSLLLPVFARTIRREHERILQRMKWYLEARVA